MGAVKGTVNRLVMPNGDTYNLSSADAISEWAYTPSPFSGEITASVPLKDEIIDEIMRRFMEEPPKMRSMSCLHCGAPVMQRVDDHILKCQYCKSAYFIDRDLIRAV